jgi:hypothetical protein
LELPSGDATRTCQSEAVGATTTELPWFLGESSSMPCSVCTAVFSTVYGQSRRQSESRQLSCFRSGQSEQGSSRVLVIVTSGHVNALVAPAKPESTTTAASLRSSFTVELDAERNILVASVPVIRFVSAMPLSSTEDVRGKIHSPRSLSSRFVRCCE